MRKWVIIALVALSLAAIGLAYFWWPAPSLRDAVRSGNAAAVDRALKSGADPNVRKTRRSPSFGSTREEPILCEAAKQGNELVVRLLLARKAATEEVGYEGLTPLGVAAKHGHREVVRLLCEHGVEVNTLPLVEPPLVESLRRRDFPTAEILIRHGALKDKPGTPRIAAAMLSQVVQGGCNVPALRFLIANGVEVNQPCPHLSANMRSTPSGDTPLKYIRDRIAADQKKIDQLVQRMNGPRRLPLQSTIDYEKKNLAVLKEAEQVLLAAGAKD
jgi:hypothetical protein